MAVNCCVVPGAMLTGDGVTAIDATSRVFRVVVPVMPLETAVMVVVPRVLVCAVTRPRGPTLLVKVAILISEELHVVEDVMFRVLPFENVPVAVSCAVVPGAMLELGGVTDKETSVGEEPELGPLDPQPDTSAKTLFHDVPP